ncbi:TetR/AcrR family transcriptional regulator C-terminal domain-containing protein [Kordiimonas gwangyangensis]|uniref:TetR/AcrR family transcriptional regulator C-terminal domain-containing protein n=2 Tax=Kordiimonas gwangyangensis TaxID=288022 RepID=UPI00036E015D|nr:TetR/AcrR family transcriptional regulator C-terminal domain-containing protein [Kordiimonas gwangyangensis]
MPKPQLSKEKIVDTAIEIADEKGHEAVTLRGIAKRLNVHVTSLYNHVPTKDAVFIEMMKKMLADADMPTGSFTWQDWIRGYAAAFRRMGYQHPGAFQAFQRGLAQGEEAMETMEAAIAAFLSDGFDVETCFCAIRATNVVVYGLCLEDMAREADAASQIDPELVPVARFPRIHEVMALSERPDTFHFLVEALIAGIEARRSGPR